MCLGQATPLVAPLQSHVDKNTFQRGNQDAASGGVVVTFPLVAHASTFWPDFHRLQV